MKVILIFKALLLCTKKLHNYRDPLKSHFWVYEFASCITQQTVALFFLLKSFKKNTESLPIPEPVKKNQIITT